MNQIKVLIAEDDVLIAEHLKSVLEKHKFQNIDLAHTKKEAFEKMLNNLPDVVLLDIRMDKEHTGIEISEYIMKNYDLPVIFITALSDKRTLDSALKTNPYGYIIKPFKAPEVVAAVRIAVQKHAYNTQRKYILIKDGFTDARIAHHDIIYVSSDKNYIDIYTKTKKYLARQTLSEFLKRTDNPIFFRVHKSYVVNINFVTGLKSDCLLINNIELPVSRTYYVDFKEAYFDLG
jgi:DNA-binding LytR/AlgR family response regulator